MEIIRNLSSLQPRHHGTVVSIGNFDGVHRGHRAVLDQLHRIGVELELPTTLITFEPHPREFFSASHAPPRLTRFREKMVELSRTALDRVLLMRFDEALSSMVPLDFVEQILVERLGARSVVVGDDFRYGHRAEGNFETMREAGKRLGFDVVRHDTFPMRGQRVSSSWVRDLLAHGHLVLAAELLGRPYSMCGRVMHGDKIGRTIGYATANMSLRRVATAVHGIYAVKVWGLGERALPGMASIGHRPTVGGTVTLLEVHLFDFERDIYGREIRVEFVAKLREEECYDGLETLKAQLARDADAAKAALESV